MLASEIVIQGLEPYAPTMSALPYSEADFLLPPFWDARPPTFCPTPRK